MATFLTADWHLGDGRFEIMQRPFTSVEQQTDILVKNFNSMVKPDDEVYIIGDAVYDRAYLDSISRFNGTKTLIRGNHDKKFTDDDFKPYFKQVIEEGHGLDITIEGIDCYMNHYPGQADPNRFNIVGHIHGAWKIQLNMLNVGVDVHHFHPVSLNRVPFFYNAICNFYDDDVWAFKLPQNAKHNETRGKKGSYFNIW